jgi:formamidopyrimidine-DNA glycosylase
VQAAYADPRRFGRVRVRRDAEADASSLGPDALDPPPESAARLRTRRGAVKAVIMDQAFLAGVGNWVADEALWAARVHPAAAAASLSPAQADAVVAGIRQVLETAVAVDADASRFPRDWIFHVRWAPTPGTRLLGEKVEWSKVGGRTTAFVPALQMGGQGGGGETGGGKAAAPAATKPKAASKPRAAKRKARTPSPPVATTRATRAAGRR